MIVFLFTLYWITIGGLFLYGLNCYFLLFTFWAHKKRALKAIAEFGSPNDFPSVTVQIPIFNERYVAERVIRAVSQFDYPTEKLQIQILDDSTDDTTEIIATTLQNTQSHHNIVHIHRRHRIGFKAGALEEGLATAEGELIAIFDADFVPKPDFLKKTVGYFTNPKMALVQARWSHLNRDYSLLTKCQALAIDGHFAIEQAAREWGGYFLNFNGTAGIWRKSAIIDAGGWEHDTLTEDLDLSYRAQLQGWQVRFLPNVDVPAEIPMTLAAFKSQQKRWAKGSIQTAIKLLPRVWRHSCSFGEKIQATLHLTHYLIHPLMFAVALLSLPVLTLWSGEWTPLGTRLTLALIIVGTLSTSSLYTGSQIFLYDQWYRRILLIPALMFLGTGIAISNSLAVLEAILGKESEFVRTPKWNLDRSQRSLWEKRQYKTKIGPVVYFEIALAAYCLFTLVETAFSGRYLISPFVLVYAMGFSCVALMALRESFDLKRAKP